MPLPPPSFTKSKWLAFFAELTAKITHHNILVVIEGCETLKRLLLTRVSIAAFLQEGTLLMNLLDTLVGGVRSERLLGPSLALNEELTFTQLETLSLCIDMMTALHADGDAYYCLLVQARAGMLMQGLLELLQRAHPHFFGITASLLYTLLMIPVGRRPPTVGDVAASQSVALRRHIQELRDLVVRQGSLLQDAADIFTAIVATSESAERFAALELLQITLKRLKKYKLQHRSGIDFDTSVERREYRAGLNHSETQWNSTPNKDVEGSGCPLDRTTTVMDDYAETDVTITEAPSPVSGSSPHPTRDIPPVSKLSAEEISLLVDKEADDSRCDVPETLIEEKLLSLCQCRSHNQFFASINALWSLTVADGRKLAECLSVNHVDLLKRFFTAAPATRQDRVLLTSLLLWLAHMATFHTLSSALREALVGVAGTFLIPLLQRDLSREYAHGATHPQAHGYDAGVSGFPPAGVRVNSTVDTNSISPRDASEFSVFYPPSGPHARFPHTVSSKSSEGMPMETPSVAVVIFSFLLNMERVATPQQLERWIRDAGMFEVVERVVRRVSKMKSTLIDTPTSMDGALSDEVYLSCALNSVRTDYTTLAVLGCKLFASIMWNYSDTLGQRLTSESSVIIQTMVPLLVDISVHNPTVTSSAENVPVSALYHPPSSSRSCRYTSLGECALVALDACLWFSKVAHLECISVADVIPSLPSLSRCSRHSITPALRATVYRVLNHLCTAPSHLIVVVREMPSAVNAAVTSVLEYTDAAPQWEVTAAAEWLCCVIDIASSDIKVEQNFNFTRTALPLRLLEIVAGSGICYATTALLRLSVMLFEQQQRFAKCIEGSSTSVLAPYGRRSLSCWIALIERASAANMKLIHVNELASIQARPLVVKDACARATNSVEKIALQYGFICSLLRSIVCLLGEFPEHRAHFPHTLIYQLIAGAFATPSPARISKLLSCRFGVEVRSQKTLIQAYQMMIEWTCELGPVWFVMDSETARSFPALPPSVYSSLCGLMEDEATAQRTRCHAALFLCSLLVLPGGNNMEAGLREYSGKLFTASLGLKKLTCVNGMQCRLVRSFRLANDVAQSSGWLAQYVQNLKRLFQSLQDSGGMLTVELREAFLVTLSFVSSVLANNECRALPCEILQSLCTSLCDGLRYEVTRLPVVKAFQSVASSPEGRRCMLFEVTAAGEPLSRTCFGRLLALSLGIQTVAVDQQENRATTGGRQHKGSVGARGGSAPTTVSQRDKNRQSIVMICYDICTTVCGKGGAPFVHALIKHRGLHFIQSLFEQSDMNRRGDIPMDLLRLVAALSFHPESQKGLFHCTTLFTILVELAGNATTEGCLALLAVRNMCFHPGLKTPLCQDMRVLLTLKAALMAHPTVEPLVLGINGIDMKENACNVLSLNESIDIQNSTLVEWAKHTAARSLAKLQSSLPVTDERPPVRAVSSGAHSLTFRDPADCFPVSDTVAAGASIEIIRRQDLAASAFCSLMYDHQRGKTYVREILQQVPSVTMDQLVPNPTLREVRQNERMSCTGEQVDKKVRNPFRARSTEGEGHLCRLEAVAI